MPLFGTFDTMQLTDVVQWILDSKVTGKLIVTVDTDETCLAFVEGDMSGVSSGDSLRLDFGQYLLAHEVITATQLQDLVMKRKPGENIKSKILEEGVVDRRKVIELEHKYALEILLDLFFFEEGSFHFSNSTGKNELLDIDDEDEGLLEKRISTRSALMEAMRRIDEWRRIKEVFPSGFTVVSAKGEDDDDPVWKKLKDLKKPISVVDLCIRMGSGRFMVYHGLYRLHSAGKIHIDEMNPGRANYADLGPVSMLVSNANLLVEEQQFEEAREVLSTVLSLEPENKEARELLKSLREAQLKYLYRQIPPHKTPVLAMSRTQLEIKPMSHKEFFLAERLNGKWDVGMLVVATPLGELDTLRVLRKLLHAGIVKLT